METASTNMVLVCVHYTSVTSFQNILPISAEASLNTLRNILLSDISPEEITSCRLLKISPVTKKPRKYSHEKRATLLFIAEEANIISRKSEISKEEIKSKSREIESLNSPNTSGLQGQKMQKKEVNKNRSFIIKRQLNVLRMKAVSAGKTMCKQRRKMTGSKV